MVTTMTKTTTITAIPIAITWRSDPLSSADSWTETNKYSCDIPNIAHIAKMLHGHTDLTCTP